MVHGIKGLLEFQTADFCSSTSVHPTCRFFQETNQLSRLRTFFSKRRPGLYHQSCLPPGVRPSCHAGPFQIFLASWMSDALVHSRHNSRWPPICIGTTVDVNLTVGNRPSWSGGLRCSIYLLSIGLAIVPPVPASFDLSCCFRVFSRSCCVISSFGTPDLRLAGSM